MREPCRPLTPVSKDKERGNLSKEPVVGYLALDSPPTMQPSFELLAEVSGRPDILLEILSNPSYSKEIRSASWIYIFQFGDDRASVLE